MFYTQSILCEKVFFVLILKIANSALSSGGVKLQSRSEGEKKKWEIKTRTYFVQWPAAENNKKNKNDFALLLFFQK